MAQPPAPTPYEVRTRAPLSLRAAKALYRRGYRRLPALVLLPALALGRLDHVVRYELGRGVAVDVPVRRNMWDAHDVLGYERALVSYVAEAAAELPTPATLVDCGADIGLFSARTVVESTAIARVVAVEPNASAHQYLRANLARLPVPAELRATAVSVRSGRGELRQPEYDASSHARFLELHDQGSIAVAALDDLRLDDGASVVLKLDVEGAELDALRGAQRMLRDAPGFVVAFEAHRQVAQRTGVDPVECLRLLRECGAVHVVLCEAPEVDLRDELDFFAQVGDDRNVFNVVCSSHEPSPGRPATGP